MPLLFVLVIRIVSIVNRFNIVNTINVDFPSVLEGLVALLCMCLRP